MRTVIRPAKPPISLQRLADDLGRSTGCLQTWAREGRLETVPRNGKHQQFVDRQYAAQIIRDWHRSIGMTEASRLHNINKAWIRNSGLVETTEVLGLRRVLHASLRASLSEYLKAQRQIVYPEKIGFGRYSKEDRLEFSRLGSSLGGKASSSSLDNRIRQLSRTNFFQALAKPFGPIPDKLIGFKKAAPFFGVSFESIRRWVQSGDLNVTYFRGKKKLRVSSLKRLRKKFEKLFAAELKRRSKVDRQ